MTAPPDVDVARRVTLPNILTLVRLCLAPAIVWLLLEGAYEGAFAAVVIAGVTDLADGAMARWLKVRSPLGAWLDPLADKVMLVSLFVTLGAKEILPVWLVVLVVSRDLLIVGGVVLAMLLAMPMKMAPLAVSKINTALQILLCAGVVTLLAFPAEWGPWAIAAGVWVVAASTVISFAGYLGLWLRMAGRVDAPSKARG